MASSAKGKGAVKTNTWGKLKKSVKSGHNRRVRRNGKDEIKSGKKDVEEEKVVKESNIVNFINAIVEGNYNTANKYLSNEVDRKLIDRMKKEYSNTIF